jgi:hypothetical protein
MRTFVPAHTMVYESGGFLRKPLDSSAPARFVVLSLGLVAGSAQSQILQNLVRAITGDKASPADIAAVRREVQGAVQSALSAPYAIQPSVRRDIERAIG